MAKKYRKLTYIVKAYGGPLHGRILYEGQSKWDAERVACDFCNLDMTYEPVIYQEMAVATYCETLAEPRSDFYIENYRYSKGEN